MFPQAASNRLHRLDLAPHSARAPLVQEFPRPCRADVFPKSLKVLPQQVAADALQVVYFTRPSVELLRRSEIAV